MAKTEKFCRKLIPEKREDNFRMQERINLSMYPTSSTHRKTIKRQKSEDDTGSKILRIE
jgi:hypothetical protein